MQRILLGIAFATIFADAAWASAVHFNIDKQAYLFLAEIVAALVGGAWFYERVRPDPRLSAMLMGTAFLVSFSAAFSFLNYLLLTVAGPRIDTLFAAADRATGFDWIAVMTVMSHHPLINTVLQICYSSVLPQIALLIIALAWSSRGDDIFRLCISIAAGAFLTVGFWTCLPSFGAFSVYTLPPDIAKHLTVALDGKYAHDLIDLLANGPGNISPRSAKGLVGFPSFHGALAMMVAWHARHLKYLRWPALVLNALVLIATPIQGGHHLTDLAGGFVVAWVAIATANRAARFARAPAPIGLPYPAPSKVAQTARS
jgi:hypothetical protein